MNIFIEDEELKDGIMIEIRRLNKEEAGSANEIRLDAQKVIQTAQEILSEDL